MATIVHQKKFTPSTVTRVERALAAAPEQWRKAGAKVAHRPDFELAGYTVLTNGNTILVFDELTGDVSTADLDPVIRTQTRVWVRTIVAHQAKHGGGEVAVMPSCEGT